MHIAMIAPLGFPLREPFAGGLEMMLSALARGLVERGHEVTLFAKKGSVCQGAQLDVRAHDYLKEDQCRAQFEREEGSYEDANEFHSYMRIMHTLATEGDRFDLVHNHSMHHLPPCLAHTLAAPFLTTLHIPPLAFFRHGIGQGLEMGRQYHVAVSEHLATSWRGDVPDVHVIHNGVSMATWGAQRGDEPVRRDVVFWAGRFCKEKAPHLAIRAALLAGCQIELAGPIYEPAYYDKEIRPLLDHEAVHLLGHIDQSEMASRMRSARCVLFTSMWDEPFGLVLIEALASGAPVAAFDSGAASEVLCERTGKIVPKGDIAGLAEAIRSVRSIDREVCQQRALRHFSMPRMIEAYETHYARIIARHHAPDMALLAATQRGEHVLVQPR